MINGWKNNVRLVFLNVFGYANSNLVAAGPSANPKPKLFLSSAKDSSKSSQETPAHSSRKRNRSNTATTAKQSKKAKKVHVADNSTAIDVANKLNAAMGNILVPNSSDDADGEDAEESMEVDEDPIQAAEGSGSGGTIQIDEPINLTPEVTMVNQDVDDAAPSSDSGTGGINFGGN